MPASGSDEKDCARFGELLRQSLGSFEVRLHAFVLLANHFHFIARTCLDGSHETWQCGWLGAVAI
jgi:REP element-mobilizing transposase RayT